ncbi:MAG: Smr/MutS family protein [Lentisphaeria bacterium]|nr:Smr/MutS family protein [Lentisphaeria bacterium]
MDDADFVDAGHDAAVDERLNAHGKIVSVSENKKTIIVSVDGVNFTMKAADLQKPTEKDEPPKPTVVKIVAPIVKGNTSHEINLIGLRVEDALEQLEPFINRSVMARIDEIRVVHGFGTGRLRAGIHEWLRRQPAVRSFRLGREPHDIGGAGCTIVKLRL